MFYVVDGVVWCRAGVADGVGGWRTYGVDPSQFPKSLMAACERMVHTGQFTPRSPVDVLSSGYTEIQQDKAPLIGTGAAFVCVSLFGLGLLNAFS